MRDNRMQNRSCAISALTSRFIRSTNDLTNDRPTTRINPTDRMVEIVMVFADRAQRSLSLARISHHRPAAVMRHSDAAKRTVAGCTPDGPLNVVSTQPAPGPDPGPARASGPCSPPQRLCDALATDRDEKRGLACELLSLAPGACAVTACSRVRRGRGWRGFH
jgi:hypothetical protein